MTSPPVAQPLPLSHRDHAILRAVAARRATMTCSVEPDLYVDGVPVCDPTAGHSLLRAGLIEPEVTAGPGVAVPAALTAAGAVALQHWSARG